VHLKGLNAFPQGRDLLLVPGAFRLEAGIDGCLDPCGYLLSHLRALLVGEAAPRELLQSLRDRLFDLGAERGDGVGRLLPGRDNALVTLLEEGVDLLGGENSE
jgi:hypothetical protein